MKDDVLRVIFKKFNKQNINLYFREFSNLLNNGETQKQNIK